MDPGDIGLHFSCFNWDEVRRLMYTLLSSLTHGQHHYLSDTRLISHTWWKDGLSCWWQRDLASGSKGIMLMGSAFLLLRLGRGKAPIIYPFSITDMWTAASLLVLGLNHT